ncbi:MAG: uroporphyrinogen-III synthase [Aestuariivirga sp.]
MKLIVTRPAQDAGTLAAALQARGHHVISMPLLRIEARKDVTIPDKPYAAVLATSANAIRSLATPHVFHHLPLYVVGPQSLAAAKAAGFSNAEAHGGDVAGLARFVAEKRLPHSKRLLYLSGAETSGDLAGSLRKKGFEVERCIIYDAVPVATIDRDALEGADGVLLYSPRTARIWNDLVPDTDAASMTHFCLSANVAKTLPQSRRILVADNPDEAAMLALLDRRT